MTTKGERQAAEIEAWAFEYLRAPVTFPADSCSPGEEITAAELELWRRWMRWKCREDMWFLASEILGYEDLDEDFHGRMCKRLERFAERDVGRPFTVMSDFWPRGGFKTTLGTVVRAIQVILRNPEETILIEHGKLDKAVGILSEIRQHFEKNEVLRWLFPDIIWKRPDIHAPKWTEKAICLKRKGEYKEQSIQVASPETGNTGGHYTFIIYDDLVCEENINTVAMMNQVYEHFRMFRNLKDERHIKKTSRKWWPWMERNQFFGVKKKDELWAPFRVAIMATRWDARDANSKIIDPKNENWAGLVDVNIVRAEQEVGGGGIAGRGDGAGRGKIVSFFPKKFPLEELAEIKKTLGPYKYAAQFMQDPYPEDAQLFRRASFGWWTPEKNDPNSFYPGTQVLWHYTAVDIAVKLDDADADRSVVMTCGVDAFGRYFMQRISSGHLTPQEVNIHILQHAKLFSPRLILFESTGAQATLLSYLRDEASTLGLYLPLKLLPRGGRNAESKERRIQAIEPVLSAKRVFLRRGDPTHEAFVDEATSYPRGRKDQLDAFADIVRNARMPAQNARRETSQALADAVDFSQDWNAQVSTVVLETMGIHLEGVNQKRSFARRGGGGGMTRRIA